MKLFLGVIITVFALAAALLSAVATQASPSAKTITVTTTADTVADDGVCSLREAIQAANTNSAVGGCPAGESGFSRDTIAFAIPGTGPHTIQVVSALPEITSTITIDGLTQPGAKCVSRIPSRQLRQAAESSVLMVVLNGSGAGATSGLVFGNGSEFASMQGLVINSFQSHGVHIRSSDSAFGAGVFCNFIGTNASGTAVMANGGSGIFIQNAPRNSIQSNVVAGNAGWGILIDGSGAADNRIEDNFIGTNQSGADLGNGRDGILAQNSGPQIIGSTYTGEGQCCLGNTIAFNGGGGVVASAALNVSYEKGIRGNRIYANDGLGIDLENDGVTLNDPGDADGEGKANHLQNFPVVSAATVNSGSVLITGTLNSTANQSFYVDFFASDTCDPSGYGEGQRFLGFETFTTNADGDVAFTATFTGTVASLAIVGNQITATATDLAGNTSEFSQCTEATGATSLDRTIFLALIMR